MMRPSLALVLSALLTFALTTTVDAQRPRTELRQATADLRIALERHGRRGPLYAAIVDLERATQRQRRAHQGRRGVRRAYRDARRAMHRARGLDDGLLDRWDRVVVAAGRVRMPTPGPVVRPTPPPAQTHVFEGRIERLPVRFAGVSIEDVEAQCNTFVQGARPTYVDDIEIAGRRHHNGSSYWSHDAICAIVALNTTGGEGATISGTVERSVPFRLTARPARARALLERLLPRALAGMRTIDDFTVDGRAYRNRSAYWNGAQVAQMIAAQLPSPHGHLQANGSIENVPFRFSGADPTTLGTQCTTFVRNANLRWVDDMTINGRHYRNRSAYWDADAICSIVSSQAQRI